MCCLRQVGPLQGTLKTVYQASSQCHATASTTYGQPCHCLLSQLHHVIARPSPFSVPAATFTSATTLLKLCHAHPDEKNQRCATTHSQPRVPTTFSCTLLLKHPQTVTYRETCCSLSTPSNLPDAHRPVLCRRAEALQATCSTTHNVQLLTLMNSCSVPLLHAEAWGSITCTQSTFARACVGPNTSLEEKPGQHLHNRCI